MKEIKIWNSSDVVGAILLALGVGLFIGLATFSTLPLPPWPVALFFCFLVGYCPWAYTRIIKERDRMTGDPYGFDIIYPPLFLIVLIAVLGILFDPKGLGATTTYFATDSRWQHWYLYLVVAGTVSSVGGALLRTNLQPKLADLVRRLSPLFHRFRFPCRRRRQPSAS